jgi:hypothetical protein
MMTQTSPFKLGVRVTTRRIPIFIGLIRGRYQRGDHKIGYVVEADAIPGLMHIYPKEALDIVSDPDQIPLGL